MGPIALTVKATPATVTLNCSKGRQISAGTRHVLVVTHSSTRELAQNIAFHGHEHQPPRRDSLTMKIKGPGFVEPS